MARRRTLRPEERELWQAVARTARPLRPPAPAAGVPSETALAPAGPSPAPSPLPAFTIGEAAAHRPRLDLAPTLSDRLAAEPLRMDAGAFRRLTRGRIAPEARIDLHGMSVAEAHPALIAFILNAQAQGLRLVLVITGKGKPGADDGPIPRRTGVLRHEVPRWLRLPPLAAVVQQVAQAHLRHGGAGALYVWLRRRG
jgi:DNA-nicking Smr family endonuclease